jgi:hypothetical protein
MAVDRGCFRNWSRCRWLLVDSVRPESRPEDRGRHRNFPRRRLGCCWRSLLRRQFVKAPISARSEREFTPTSARVAYCNVTLWPRICFRLACGSRGWWGRIEHPDSDKNCRLSYDQCSPKRRALERRGTDALPSAPPGSRGNQKCSRLDGEQVAYVS